jgi:hypothetical protein
MRSKRAIHHKKAGTGNTAKVLGGKREVKDWSPIEVMSTEPLRLGPGAGGQSGDIEGLPDVAFGDSESVAELVEEGQDLEAEKVSGIENTPDPDEIQPSEEAFEEEG